MERGTVSPMDLERELSKYDYPIDPSQIAEAPAHPRDSARLLVADASGERYDTFLHLDRYLEPGTLLILNDTKVVPARLPCYLPTGGKVELLWLNSGKAKGTFEALSPRTLSVGTTLELGGIMLTIREKRESVYVIEHSSSPARFHAAMMELGTTPIPPYLKHTTLAERKLRSEYQTIFAKREGSVAAPTASLHFTKRLLAKLKERGIKVAFVTLHVGLGTFAPLTEDQLNSGRLHEEYFVIPPVTARAILKAKKEGRKIIPVGTTALRTLESAASYLGKSDFPKKGVSGKTDLFIREGYRFAVADGLITNFHVPRSSLLMLVAALVGHLRHADGRKNILDLYQSALRHNLRFYSFGDGMLIR